MARIFIDTSTNASNLGTLDSYTGQNRVTWIKYTLFQLTFKTMNTRQNSKCLIYNIQSKKNENIIFCIIAVIHVRSLSV